LGGEKMNKIKENNISENIERVSIKELGIEDFEQKYLLQSEPVIITDIFEICPKLTSWTPDYLSKKIKNKIVRVNTSNDGRFGLDPEKGGFVTDPVFMPFNKFVKSLKKSVRKLYIGQVSILRELMELRDEVNIPKYISTKDIRMNLWFGPGGNTSPLHYDGMNNFFIQVYGTKQILLSSHCNFKNLYPHPWYSKAPHTSRINIDNLNSDIYPKTSKADFIKFTIYPGEMLFIPIYWWKAKVQEHFTLGGVHNLLHYTFYAFKKIVRS